MLEESYELVYVDPSKCVGCRSCEIACAVEHSLSKNLFLSITEKPLPRKRIRVISVDNFTVPMRCMHCEDAPCIAVCPTGAMEKTAEGFVVVNSPKCIGCRMCMMACPFGHPIYDSLSKILIKCDHCPDRMKEGLPPACVEACPTGALRYGKVEEILGETAVKKAKELVSGLGKMEVLYRTVIPEKLAPESPVQKIKEMYGSVRWW
jgi:carbon-monoxide dehydrogenase iron sulfur subunit